MDNWKDMLRLLKLQHLERKTPAAFAASGGYTMKVNPYTDKTANGLTRCIVDFICFVGGDANRINTQGQLRKIRGEMKWTHGGTRRGTADIHAIFEGRHVSIEIKIGSDRQSDEQHKERERITRAGGVYIVASSFPNFYDNWTKQGFPVPNIVNNNKIQQHAI